MPGHTVGSASWALWVGGQPGMGAPERLALSGGGDGGLLLESCVKGTADPGKKPGIHSHLTSGRITQTCQSRGDLQCHRGCGAGRSPCPQPHLHQLSRLGLWCVPVLSQSVCRNSKAASRITVGPTRTQTSQGGSACLVQGLWDGVQGKWHRGLGRHMW